MSDTKQAIIDFFKENPESFALHIWYEGVSCGVMREDISPEELSILLGGYPNLKVSYLSCNDEGEDYYEVFNIVEFKWSEGWGDKAEEKVLRLKFYGYHRSHDGTYYEGVKEVKPVTKTIEVWE